MSWREILRANARLGWVMLRADWPPVVWLVGALLPEVIRMLVFVAIGALAGGPDGARYALVGCVVLSIAGTCVSSVTDIPASDVGLGTYRTIAAAGVPVFAQYVVRALALGATALVIAVCVAMALGIATGQPAMIWPLVMRVWMLLPAVAAATMLGLVVIAPAIGSNWEGITYNVATALLTVVSGAVFAVTVPVLQLFGDVLPLTHAIRALRASLTGDPWMGEWMLEFGVAAGWCVIGALIYRAQTLRGRRTGRGAYAA